MLINIACIAYTKKENQYHNLLKAKEFQNIIKSMIIDNIILLKQAKFENIKDTNIKISIIRDYIKNQIFASENSNNSTSSNVSLPGYLNLQELLNDAASVTFKYIITINNNKIISNSTLEDSQKALTSEQYRIDKDLICKVLVTVNPSSTYTKQLQERSSKRVLSIIIGTNVILFSLILGVYYYLNKQKRIKKELSEIKLKLEKSYKRNKEIINYTEKNKEFILKCYKYSKNFLSDSRAVTLVEESIDLESKSNEYLPLPIMPKEIIGVKNTILIQPLIKEIKDYFHSYEAFHDTKIDLEIKVSTETIKVPFQPEEFNQIFISFFVNILNFNKGKKQFNYIKLHFIGDTIICSSNGFALNQELAIKYSEKIFNDTANPYLMNLRQIFVLFKICNIDYTVTVKNNQETVFEVNLQSNENNRANNKVIRLDKFKKRRL